MNIGTGEQFKPESGAILFLPQDLRGRYEVLQWVNWQMGGLRPMAGQANHFNVYAPQSNPAEALKYGQDRYTTEVNRLFGVLDKRLADRAYVACEFSFVDMAIWPWVVKAQDPVRPDGGGGALTADC